MAFFVFLYVNNFPDKNIENMVLKFIVFTTIIISTQVANARNNVNLEKLVKKLSKNIQFLVSTNVKLRLFFSKNIAW